MSTWSWRRPGGGLPGRILLLGVLAVGGSVLSLTAAGSQPARDAGVAAPDTALAAENDPADSPPAPTPRPFPPRLQLYLQEGIDNGRLQAVAAGWIDRGQIERVFLGHIGAGDRAPRGSDAFELGSTTRIFTGLLFAHALLRGEVQRDTTLAEIFTDIEFGDTGLAGISLEQLATQRSGLAALPLNLFPRHLDDPLVNYDDHSLHELLRYGNLTYPAGKHAYSDTGTALLGQALARVMEDDYRQLVASRVLAPLGLEHSGFGSVPGLVRGHYLGSSVAHWQLQALAPAGGIRATLDDLLKLLEHNLAVGESPERAMLLLARQPLAAAGGGLTALGWQVVNAHGDGDVDSWPVIWQAGVSGGFASFVGFRTDRQRALVLLGNARTDLSAAGLALLADQELPTPPARRHAQSIELPVGLYRLDDGGELLLRANGETGMDAQFEGTWPVDLHHEGNGRYRFGDSSRLLTVVQDEDREHTRIILLDRNFNLHGTRLSHGVPTLPRKPRGSDPQELKDYAGTYRLDAGSWLRVTQRGEALFVQPAGRPERELHNHARDRFNDTDGWMQVHFQRGPDGDVNGLQLRAGLRDESATRLY